jgi:hypothetical protein
MQPKNCTGKDTKDDQGKRPPGQKGGEGKAGRNEN